MAAPNANGYGRAGFYVSLAMVVFTIIGAVTWVGAIANEVSQNRAALDAHAVRLDIITADLRSNDLLTSNITRDLREVETQFCASDIVRNLMHANDMRTVSLLWGKIYRERFPTDNAYYPTVCNRPMAQQ